MADSPAVRVVAVASRSGDKAREFATTFKLPCHLGSYEALLTDPEVDAIYLPLPNSLHAERAIAAGRCHQNRLPEPHQRTSRGLPLGQTVDVAGAEA